MDFSDGILKEHNKQPYINLINDLNEYGKGCAIHATGTGKMYLALKWLNDNKNEPFTYLAPSKAILNKFANLIIERYFKNYYSDLKYASIEDKLEIIRTLFNNENINFITYSKLNFMSEGEVKEIKTKNIVLDEFHHLGADKWGSATKYFLDINKDSKVLGLSATPIRPTDKKNMVDLLFEGRISSNISLQDSINGELLPKPRLVFGIYSFEEELNALEERLDNSYIDDKDKEKISEKLKRARRLIDKDKKIKDIFKSELSKLDNANKAKFIVFCMNIEDMKKKMEECVEWFDQGAKLKIQGISSDERYIDNERIISSFEKEDFDGINLLFSVNMANEGLHVPNLTGVIMLRPTESRNIFLQQLGRALAVDDSIKEPLVFDLTNNVRVMRKDMEEYNEITGKFEIKEGKEKDKLDFVMQSEIIDIIDYLHDICDYYTSRRIRDNILLEYCKDESHPNLANVRVNEKFNYQGKEINIGNMITVARCQYKMRSLNEEEKKQSTTRPLDDEEVMFFESLGMVWEKYLSISFEEKIKIIKEYCLENNLDISDIKKRDIYKGYLIGSWVQEFRSDYKNGKLQPEEIEILNEMNLSVFTSRGISFEEKISIIKEYLKVSNKRIKDIAREDKYKGYSIKYWIDNFNKRYRENRLNEEEIKVLVDLGIVKEINVIVFDKKIKVIEDYCKKNNIKFSDIVRSDTEGEYKIGRWIDIFRERYKDGYLTQYEIDTLNNLGMIWEKNKVLSTKEKIVILEQYCKETQKNLSQVKSNEQYLGYNIGDWLYKLKKRYKDGMIKKEEIEGLIKLGLVMEKKR